MTTDNDNPTLLEIKDLRSYFFTEDGVVKAVDGLDLKVRRGEVMGLVGESGCGKSVTSLSIMQLIELPGKIVSGSIEFDGLDMLKLSESEIMKVRGNRIAMIFQQPQSSLNPVFKVGAQIVEVLRTHFEIEKEEAWNKTVDLLRQVGISEAERRAHAYPHELSGGMAQRVMIAMALAGAPELLIADEPTTALDVTIQAQILDLMRDLRTKIDTAVILITHDLGIIAEMAERVAVMYAGRIVEEATVETLFAQPMHPYTQGLIGSIPVLGQVKDELTVIPGSVPNLIDLPPGCKFAPRCQARMMHDLQICFDLDPDLSPVSDGHKVRCWLYKDGEGHVAPLAMQSATV